MHFKGLKFRLMLTLLTALLLTLLTTYFWFGGWRYTLFILTNQNHSYMPNLNDCKFPMFCFCMHKFTASRLFSQKDFRATTLARLIPGFQRSTNAQGCTAFLCHSNNNTVLLYFTLIPTNF